MATQNYFKVKNGLEIPSLDTLYATDVAAPSVRPSLDLNFAGTKKLDPRITFARSSTATYYDGKSVVKAEENLFQYSQEFDSSAWTKNNLTVTANATTAPDGSITADSVTPSAGNPLVYQLSPSAGTYTFSVYAKAGTGTSVTLACTVSFTGRAVTFDLGTGTVGSVGSYSSGANSSITGGIASITYVGNGWYRCVLAGITIDQARAFHFGPGLANGTYTGGAYFWGAQLEQRSIATAYTSTAVTTITNYIQALQTAAANTARFDHDPTTSESKGLLIEESRTNLVTYASVFEAPAWVKSGCTINASACTAPDGTVSGALVTSSGDAGGPRQDLSLTNGATYTSSVYIKAGTLTSLLFRDDAGAGRHLDINPATGQITGTAGSISNYGSVSVGNGWYRYYMTYTTDYAGGRHWVRSNSGAGTFYLWGAQTEAGAFATSYIPTPLTYTGRASTATYRSTDGTIRIAQPNVARYEPNSAGGSNLLLEGAATNYFTDESGGIALVGGYSAGYSLDTAAPDGSYTATKYIWDKSTGSFYGDTSPGAINATNAGAYTYSVWMKIPAGKKMSIAILYSAGGNIEPEFVGTGRWERYSVTKIFGASDTGYIRLHPFMQRSPAASDAAQEVLIWGMQLEAGSAPTAYVYPTKNHTGRSSTATYYDSTGTIRTAASGQPRYTYNPSLLTAAPKLLLEAQATNLITYSQAFSGWSKSYTTSSSGAGASTLFGFATDRITLSAVTGEHYVGTGVGSIVNGAVYTASFYVRPNSLIKGFQIYFPYAALSSVDFNLTTLTCGSAGTITALPDGWYRISATFTASNTSSSLYLFAARTPGVYTFTSDGTEYYDICGAQFEAGYAPTSYIPTSGSAVTRAADTSTSAAGSRAADVYSSSQVTRATDTAAITGTNFSSWYSNGQGTLHAVYTDNDGTGTRALNLRNAAGTKYIDLVSGSGSSAGGYWNVTAVSGAFNGIAVYENEGVQFNTAFAWNTNDYVEARAGAITQTNATLTMTQDLNSMYIGNSGGSAQITGNIKRIVYYPKRLSNAELQALTSQ